MDAKELLVHECSQRQRIKGFHACIVDTLGVFDFALLLECEVFGQMPALVIAAQQEEGVWVADFECPKVEDTLNAEVATVHIVTKELMGSSII